MGQPPYPRDTLGTTAPTLDPGLTCLAVEGPQSPAIVDLAVAALTPHARVYWVDARNAASTYRLYDRAVSDRVLSGLQIARAFTAYQHFSLARALIDRVDAETDLVCLPNCTHLYRDDDVPTYERDTYLRAVLAGLGVLAARHDVPVLVSTTHDDALAERVHDAADRRITAERTAFGLRYDGDGVDQHGYHHGAYWQTTIPYWVELYGAAADTSLVEAAAAAEFAGVA